MVSEGMVGDLEHSHKPLQQIFLLCSAVALGMGGSSARQSDRPPLPWFRAKVRDPSSFLG